MVMVLVLVCLLVCVGECFLVCVVESWCVGVALLVCFLIFFRFPFAGVGVRVCQFS